MKVYLPTKTKTYAHTWRWSVYIPSDEATGIGSEIRGVTFTRWGANRKIRRTIARLRREERLAHP